MGILIVVTEAKPKRTVAAEVQRKVCEGTCLGCGKAKAEQKGPFRKGNCDPCYKEIAALMDKMSPEDAARYEERLIHAGKWTARGQVAMYKRLAKSIAYQLAQKFLR